MTLQRLEEIGRGILEELTRQDRLREEALRHSRAAIRAAALAIRAVHRDSFEEAEGQIAKAEQAVARLGEIVAACPLFTAAGYVTDAQKEYAEACLTYALIRGRPLPSPAELAVPVAPFLNALGEAVGELRRSILDGLRRDRLDRCEERLEMMQEIYEFLTLVDFPDALTGGLRRTTDVVRRILENTRGDLTTAMRQRRLQVALERFEHRIAPGDAPSAK